MEDDAKSRQRERGESGSKSKEPPRGDAKHRGSLHPTVVLGGETCANLGPAPKAPRPSRLRRCLAPSDRGGGGRDGGAGSERKRERRRERERERGEEGPALILELPCELLVYISHFLVPDPAALDRFTSACRLLRTMIGKEDAIWRAVYMWRRDRWEELHDAFCGEVPPRLPHDIGGDSALDGDDVCLPAPGLEPERVGDRGHPSAGRARVGDEPEVHATAVDDVDGIRERSSWTSCCGNYVVRTRLPGFAQDGGQAMSVGPSSTAPSVPVPSASGGGVQSSVAAKSGGSSWKQSHHSIFRKHYSGDARRHRMRGGGGDEGGGGDGRGGAGVSGGVGIAGRSDGSHGPRGRDPWTADDRHADFAQSATQAAWRMWLTPREADRVAGFLSGLPLGTYGHAMSVWKWMVIAQAGTAGACCGGLGAISLSSGPDVIPDTYCGEVSRNKPDGRGMVFFVGSEGDDVEVHGGPLEFPFGAGRLAMLDRGSHQRLGGWAAGEFHDGRLCGRALVVYNDGTEYVGECRNDEFWGEGSLFMGRVLSRLTGIVSHVGRFKRQAFGGQGVRVILRTHSCGRDTRGTHGNSAEERAGGGGGGGGGDGDGGGGGGGGGGGDRDGEDGEGDLTESRGQRTHRRAQRPPPPPPPGAIQSRAHALPSQAVDTAVTSSRSKPATTVGRYRTDSGYVVSGRYTEHGLQDWAEAWRASRDDGWRKREQAWACMTRDGRREGQGIAWLRSGALFRGRFSGNEMREGTLQGEGHYTWQGRFHRGAFHGWGVVIDERDGSVYAQCYDAKGRIEEAVRASVALAVPSSLHGGASRLPSPPPSSPIASRSGRADAVTGSISDDGSGSVSEGETCGGDNEVGGEGEKGEGEKVEKEQDSDVDAEEGCVNCDEQEESEDRGDRDDDEQQEGSPREVGPEGHLRGRRRAGEPGVGPLENGHLEGSATRGTDHGGSSYERPTAGISARSDGGGRSERVGSGNGSASTVVATAEAVESGDSRVQGSSA